jgi:predicted metal-dependent peptidase
MSNGKADASTHGIDLEAVKKPITQADIDAAKEAMGIAITLLLCPRGDKARNMAFYAHSLMQFRTEYTNKIPTAGVSVTDKVNLYVNPHFLLGLSVGKRIELLIHEIEHVLNLHMIRGKELKEKSGLGERDTHQLYNIATDANINIPLHDLTEDLGVTIERLNKQLEQYGSKQRLSESDASEVHFWKLRQFQEEMGDKLPKGFGEGEGGEIDDHSIWDESSENEELAKAIVKEAMNKAAEATGIGNCPSHVVKALGELNKSLVNWKRELQQFAVRTLKFARERTRSKRNRRTGLINPGSRKEPKVKLALIGDESGSMCDEQVAQVFSEVEKIASMGIEVLYIPMDSECGEVIPFKKGMKLNRSRAGGTCYQPPLNKAKELDVDAVVFFGDFDCFDKPTKPKFPVLWVGINTQSPSPGDFGKVIYVDTKK